MKKALLLLFGVLVALPAISQTKLGELTKVWETKHISVSDGFVYKYKMHAKYDTAIYYEAGADTFEVVTTFKKISGKPQPPKPDIVTTMDDNTVSIAQTYNPTTNLGDNVQNPNGWTHFVNQSWNAPYHNKTGSVLRVAGYVELTCTCYKVEWWSEKRVNHGIVGVSIDAGPPVDLDLYDVRTDNNSLLVWTSPSMTNEQHKIRITFTGRKNPAATETNYVHDKFVIYTKQ